MSKKFLLSALTAVLFASSPFSALANDTLRSANVESQETVSQIANYETDLSVQGFIDRALAEISYQHASKEMQVDIVQQWVHKGELQNRKKAINSGEIARILIRALGEEKDEISLDDYLNSAKIHGLLKVHTNVKNTVTVDDLDSIFNNYKKASFNNINNKGVKEISVEDFMKNPGDFGYELSPDGNYISYTSAWESRSNVFVKRMNDDSDPVRVTSSKDRDIAGSFWKDDQILYAKDDAGDENYHIYSSSFNNQEEKNLTPYPGVRVQMLSNLQGIKDEILIMMNKEDPTVFDVYRLNIKTGETTHVAKNPGNIVDWLADRDGKIRIAIESDGIDSTVLYRDTEEEDFKPFLKTEAGDSVSPIAFSKDNKSIYALSNKDRDKIELVNLDFKANEKVIYSNPQVDVIGAAYDASRDKILYSLYITDKLHYSFFDKEFETLFNKLKDKLNVSESELSINDYNQEMTKFIVAISSDKLYGTYYYYDSKTDELEKLADLGSWLDPNNLADMHPISYKSRDGLTIHGYLTLPKNKNQKIYR